MVNAPGWWIVIQIISTLFTMVTGTAAAYLVLWVRTLKAEMKNEVNETLRDYVTQHECDRTHELERKERNG